MTDPNQFPGAAITVEDQNPLATVSQVLQGFAGHIGTGLRSGYETVRGIPRNIKTYKMLGVSAITSFALSHAEAAVANPDSAAAESVHTRSADVFSPDSALTPWAIENHSYQDPGSAQASTIEQDCVTAGLTMPQVLAAKMLRAGHARQTVYVNANYQPMPEACHGLYKRLGEVVNQIQDAKNHKRWYDLNTCRFEHNDCVGITKPNWYAGVIMTQDEGGVAGITNTPTGHEGSWTYWRKGEKVRSLFRNIVKSSQTGKIEGVKIAKVPVTVYR